MSHMHGTPWCDEVAAITAELGLEAEEDEEKEEQEYISSV